MNQDVTAEIISIGTEILLGELTDTNSVYIARVMRDLGINLYTMVSVGDNRKRIAEAVRAAMSRADLVITCGGLGPTVDDMTRQSVADATDRGLTFHQSLLDQIAERFRGFNVQMTENNRQQAYLPDNATVIENPVGTAPAFIVEHQGRIVISLPGVPREMKFLMSEHVVPFLRERYWLGIIKARVLKSAGIGESALDDLIGRDLLEQANPTIGLAAHMGQIDIRITAKADSSEEADTLIAQTEAAVLTRAGRFVFGADEQTLEEVFVRLLSDHDFQVAVIEAGIHDVLTSAVRSVPEGDKVLASVQHYAHPDDLVNAFDLDGDLPLREKVHVVAHAVCQQKNVDGVIVIASNPEVVEGVDTVEATVIAVCTSLKYRDRVYGFGAQSDFARAWGKSWLLSTAWRLLKEQVDAE